MAKTEAQSLNHFCVWCWSWRRQRKTSTAHLRFEENLEFSKPNDDSSQASPNKCQNAIKMLSKTTWGPRVPLQTGSGFRFDLEGHPPRRLAQASVSVDKTEPSIHSRRQEIRTLQRPQLNSTSRGLLIDPTAETNLPKLSTWSAECLNSKQ